jgi:hypothetical protein
MRLKRTTSPPSNECIAHGHKIFSQIDRGASGHSGTLMDEKGVVRWRYGTRKNTAANRLANPFNKSDFLVVDPNGTDQIVIRRASFIPPVFNIVRAGTIIGRLKMRSLFRNKYSIEIDQVNTWTFRMPLFTVRFFGESGAGPEIWVVVGPSKMEWGILIAAAAGEWPLIAALAFIHVEAWNYG